MLRRGAILSLCALVTSTPVLAQESSIMLEGDVPDGPETHFFLPFDVPEGVVEIEVRHDDLSDINILDWGLDDPNGFRGWGGGNTEPAVVGIDAASRSYVPGPIVPGTWEVVVGKALVEEQPARYQVEVILRATATVAPQTEREPYGAPPALETGARWYAGDFHVHSRESGDARPTIDEVLSFAESRGLDFVLLSEHNTTSQLSLYAAAQQRNPNVLLLPGAEFTTYQGHANAIGATEWIDHRTGVRDATIEGAIADTHAQGALFSISHPLLNVGNLCIGCGWAHQSDPLTIDAVEVKSGVFVAVGFWEELLAAGSHAVAIGGSDDHDAGQRMGTFNSPIGTATTMVYAEELSVAAILQGVRDGRTVVKFEGPDGPMIETELSGSRDGDTVSADQASLRASVSGAAGTMLRTVRNGETIDERPIDSDPFVSEVDVQAPSSGEDRYRHEVFEGDDVLAVASHVWLRAPEDSGGGCAVRPSEASPTTAIPWLVGILIVVWAARRTLYRPR